GFEVGPRKSLTSEFWPQSAIFVAPPSSEKYAGVWFGLLPSNRRMPGWVKRTKSSAEKYVTPPKTRFSGTRPMACPSSCRNADMRSPPGANWVPMPTKPSVKFVNSPKHAPTLELIQKFVLPFRLVSAGRLAALKKPGCPKVSRSCLSCEYVNVNKAAELISASEMSWF